DSSSGCSFPSSIFGMPASWQGRSTHGIMTSAWPCCAGVHCSGLRNEGNTPDTTLQLSSRFFSLYAHSTPGKISHHLFILSLSLTVFFTISSFRSPHREDNICLICRPLS